MFGPAVPNSYAKICLKQMNVDVVMEHYVPFGLKNMTPLLDNLEASGADAVLVSLVGQDAVQFNRAFGRRGLDSRILRLACALEENGLLACGKSNLERLFSVSSYFGSISTQENAAFKEAIL